MGQDDQGFKLDHDCKIAGDLVFGPRLTKIARLPQDLLSIVLDFRHNVPILVACYRCVYPVVVLPLYPRRLHRVAHVVGNDVGALHGCE